MGQETDYFHLLTQHPVALLILGSLIVLGLLLVIAVVINRISAKGGSTNDKDQGTNHD